MVRFPGWSATLRVLSISFLAFLLRISTLTLELLSILMYGLFLDFFNDLTFDLIDSTKFSNWFIAIWVCFKKHKTKKKRKKTKMVGLLGIWVVYNASSILCLSLEHTHTHTLLLNSVFAFASVSAFLVLYGGFYWLRFWKMGMVLAIITSLPRTVHVWLHLSLSFYCMYFSCTSSSRPR